MWVGCGKEESLKELLEVAHERGYLLYDDLMDSADSYSLPIYELAQLIEDLKLQGVIIYDEAPSVGQSSILVADADEEVRDFARIDYEALFSRVLQMDPSLAPFIDKVRNIRPPQVREMAQLKYHLADNPYARQRVFEMYLRFAVKFAVVRAENFRLEIADVIQDACIGLLTAIDSFDPQSNGIFDSYASFWIFQHIQRSQSTQRPLIYYPVYKRHEYFTVYPYLKKRGCLDCDNLLTCEKIRNELIEINPVFKEDADEIISACLPIEFLEDVLEKEFDGDIEAFAVTINAIESIDSEYLAERRACINLIWSAGLDDRAQKIMMMRYGLYDGIAYTLEEVGQQFGVTRERIRQIEKKSIRLMQSAKSRRHLSLLDLMLGVVPEKLYGISL